VDGVAACQAKPADLVQGRPDTEGQVGLARVKQRPESATEAQVDRSTERELARGRQEIAAMNLSESETQPKIPP
jgi:hypothetical protein